MQLHKIHFHHICIPLRVTFAQANQSTAMSDSVVVRIETGKGNYGFGESCPRTYVTAETAETVSKTIGQLQECLLKTEFAQIEDIEKWVLAQLDQGKPPATICAIELALIDAWCSENKVNMVEALGGIPAQTVCYSGVVPYGDWEKLTPVLKAFDFPSLKFKAYQKVEENQQRIQNLKVSFGQKFPLRTDANGGWNYEEARKQIKAGLTGGLSSFEQPLHPRNDDEAAKLVAEFGTKASIMADESLVTYDDAKKLVAKKQCNHFNLKISKHGGLFNTLRIYRLAQENNIPCQLGAHYGETSILAYAGLLFAQLAPDLTAVEGGLGTFLLKEDLSEIPIMINKRGEIEPQNYTGSGCPIKIDELRLSLYSRQTQLWKR